MDSSQQSSAAAGAVMLVSQEGKGGLRGWLTRASRAGMCTGKDAQTKMQRNVRMIQYAVTEACHVDRPEQELAQFSSGFERRICFELIHGCLRQGV